jgi:hypothetical protein
MTESPMHLPLKYVEALIIAESEVLLARVRAARVAALENVEKERENERRRRSDGAIENQTAAATSSTCRLPDPRKSQDDDSRLRQWGFAKHIKGPKSHYCRGASRHQMVEGQTSWQTYRSQRHAGPRGGYARRCTKQGGRSITFE